MIEHTQPGLVNIQNNLIAINNIYTFAHCNIRDMYEHFDNSIDSNIIVHNNECLEFTKIYRFAKHAIELTHHIKCSSSSICWTINRQNDLDILPRFGITFPHTYHKINLLSGETDSHIINYSTMWRPNYPDQTNIDTPLLKIGNIAISTNEDSDMQIYTYRDNGVDYVKICSLSEHSDSLSINIDYCKNLREFYNSISVPTTKEYWELLIKKIRKNHNINIITDQSVRKLNITGRTPVADELMRYIPILDDELSKYGDSTLQDLGIETITLFSGLYDDICGMHYNGSILFNCSLNMSTIDLIKTIHHEIFHAAEDQLGLPNSDKLAEKFADLMTGLLSYDDIDPVDHLFYSIVNSLYNSHKIDVPLVKNTYITTRASSSQHNTLNFNNNKKSKYSVITGLDNMNYGLIAAMSNVDHISINAINQYEMYNILSVIQNPLTYCAVGFLISKKDVEDSFQQYIINANALKHTNILKEEDILNMNYLACRSFFDRFSININIDSLFDQYDHPIEFLFSDIPHINKIWNIYKSHPTIINLGYDLYSCED